MNKDQVVYTCTAMPPGKRGALKKDEHGYYEVILGALNAFSNVGDYYEEEGSKELFEASSMFQRRINQGLLYGEMGHPYPLPGEKFQDFAKRCAVVSEKNVSHHFRQIRLEYNHRDETGKPIILIMGLIKPEGPHAEALRSNLENPFTNSCFSIRAFTDDQTIGGVLHRRLTEIITFDFVLESGMKVARKYSSPTLESLHSIPMTKKCLMQTQEELSGIPAMESTRDFYFNLFRKKGWDIEMAASGRNIVIDWAAR